MQLRKFRVRFGKINHIFISHLHGDHVFGLYGLLSSFSLMGRKKTLNLYAPGNYEEILHSHLNDFDIHLSYNIKFTALGGKNPALILDDKYITVTAFPLRHRIPAFGFLFREKQHDRNIKKECIEEYQIPVVRIPAIKKGEDFLTSDGRLIKNEELTLPSSKSMSFAYCSDTKYFRELASYVKDVDLLYHEATFDRSLGELAKITGHSTTIEAATTALKAGAGSLLIGHFSSRYKDITLLVEEARTIFPQTFPAIEGSSFEVGNNLNA
jgi:ribonuclease Z